MSSLLGVEPAFVDRGIITSAGADAVVALYLRYIGEEASGKVAIANTTGDMSFTHGDVGSEAADTTVNPAGGVAGTIDLSGEAATFQALAELVNASANWELIPVGYLPTDATEASGTAKIVNNVSATQAKTATGMAVYFDRSASLHHSIGITANGPSSEPHGFDAGMRNIINLLSVTLTYSSGTHLVKVYEVDDIEGTATELASFSAAATTVALTRPTSGTPGTLWQSEGKRLVVKQVSTTAEPSAWTYEIHWERYQTGPGIRKSKMWAYGPCT